MRQLLIGIGAVMIFLGGLWTLQDVGILPGSFMTGQSFRATVGLLLTAGVVLCIIGTCRPESPPL